MSSLSFPTRSNTQTLMTTWCVYSLSVILKVDSSMCKCARMQIPMGSEPSWGLSHAKGILNMLPQHVIAAPPTCSVWIACFTPPHPLPGPLSMRNLNKPVPFTSNSIHHLLFITSNQQRGKVTHFYPLFLLIRNLPLDRWTLLTLLMWLIFHVWYMLILPGDCTVKLSWII